jgi:DNA (cytosine-5)-methyltransferase 1
MSKPPRVISLYSGAGGLDYGFEAAGFRTAAAVEWDHDSCETLRKNRRFAVIEKSIHDVPTSHILDAGKLAVGEADVLIGGPPCQPFSKSGFWASGDTLRLDDPRADTLRAYLHVLEEAKPKAFLLENVEGLSYAGKSDGVELLLREIKKINRRQGTAYKPCFQVLCAADYGVPQQRNRFFMVAGRDGLDFQFPAPTHGGPAEQAQGELPLMLLEPYMTAWDALGDELPPTEEDLAVKGKWARLLPSIPEGENYLWHTDRGRGIPLFGWRRRYWSFLLKLAKARISWTLQAQPGPAVGPFHWTNRRLSAREMSRLQTFPEDVTIVGSRGSVQRQLGNAVPSLLAEVLAREIRAQLLGRGRPRGELHLLPQRRGPAPPEEPIGDVPPEYLHLEGEHEAHPGTGKGYRAVEWSGLDDRLDHPEPLPRAAAAQ